MVFETECILRPNLGTSCDIPDVPPHTSMPFATNCRKGMKIPSIFISSIIEPLQDSVVEPNGRHGRKQEVRHAHLNIFKDTGAHPCKGVCPFFHPFKRIYSNCKSYWDEMTTSM